MSVGMLYICPFWQKEGKLLHLADETWFHKFLKNVGFYQTTRNPPVVQVEFTGLPFKVWGPRVSFEPNVQLFTYNMHSLSHESRDPGCAGGDADKLRLLSTKLRPLGEVRAVRK